MWNCKCNKDGGMKTEIRQWELEKKWYKEVKKDIVMQLMWIWVMIHGGQMWYGKMELVIYDEIWLCEDGILRWRDWKVEYG